MNKRHSASYIHFQNTLDESNCTVCVISIFAYIYFYLCTFVQCIVCIKNLGIINYTAEWNAFSVNRNMSVSVMHVDQEN